MLRLDVLGSIALSRADGVPVRSVLAQPKRLALLAYLASSHPPASHPRDALLALLWPELDQERARRALRQALHGLRKSLGPGVLTGKGHEMVGVDSERLRCDVVSFSRAVEDGRDAEALELYRGDFLQGFHVSGVPEFEHWSERRGRELRLAAVEVAWRVVETAEAAGRTGEARRAGERALELDPFGGETVRRYLGLMDRLGQPADAIRAYQSYAERLQQELDLAPSPETRALAETIREGGGSSEGWERSSVGRDAAESPHEPSPEDDSENLVAEAGDRPTESGPETGPRTGPPRSPGRLRRSLFRRRAAIGVPIAALLGVFAYAGLNESESSGPAVTDRPIRSVAVLPFADLSPAGDQQWFGDGVAEEILDVLARIEPLQVTARSSSFQFEGRNVDVRALGDSLGVGAVLEGSVRRAGNRVRITVQLVRTSDGTHLWSESYDRALTSETIFVTQEEIARSVADALEVELGLTTPALRVAERPAGLEAYSLYLQARHAIRERTGEGRGRALPLIREALEHDPNFARAWALLARWHVQAPFWEPFDGAVDLETSRARSLQAARRALELAPDLAEAHATLGFVLDHHHRWTEAWSHHSRALELDPGFPEARAYALWH
ncbi:MAG: BTAD domain-containing putative transcriptional regulator, partial [Gemmatimonadota bacterium]